MVDMEEIRRLREKGHGVHAALKISKANEIKEAINKLPRSNEKFIFYALLDLVAMKEAD